jgi:hypothetical protein
VGSWRQATPIMQVSEALRAPTHDFMYEQRTTSRGLLPNALLVSIRCYKKRSSFVSPELSFCDICPWWRTARFVPKGSSFSQRTVTHELIEKRIWIEIDEADCFATWNRSAVLW